MLSYVAQGFCRGGAGPGNGVRMTQVDQMSSQESLGTPGVTGREPRGGKGIWLLHGGHELKHEGSFSLDTGKGEAYLPLPQEPPQRSQLC